MRNLRKADPRVRERRGALGLTQEVLAEIVRLSRRSIVAIEKGKPAKDSNVKRVEQAVGIGLPEWVLSPAKLVDSGGVAVQIHIAASTWPEVADRYYLFVRSLLLDASGEHNRALRLLESAIACDEPQDGAFACATRIHLACVQDHRKKYSEARQAAERAIAIAKASNVTPPLLWWSEYQLAIALINLDDLSGAQYLLVELENSSKEGARKVAAMHQLGVVQFRLKRFDKAVVLFERCIQDRSEEDPRLAYEYHGLAKVYGEQRIWKLCSKHLKIALSTALRHGFERYVKEIRATAQVYESRSKQRLL